MCGICGYVGPEREGALSAMCSRLAHRGPDAAGAWRSADRSVHLGHRRLSILDHVGGAQPMTTRDGALTIVFNGEIYNFRELRSELEAAGCEFSTDHSDTEVLLHGWREWGEALFAKLNGMWAFALHDATSRTLVACRDRFGKKPFFYSHDSSGFRFASELSALLAHPEVPRSLSVAGLKKFFAYGYLPAPHSAIEGVKKLPAAHWLRLQLDSGALEVRRWWRFTLEPTDTLPADPGREWGAQLLELLGRAVRRRLVADVPVGVFLSGGLDSTTVAALAASASSSPAALKTFTIGFEEPSFDESPWAALAARALGTDHASETLRMADAPALLPEILSRMDEPLGDNSLLPTFLLARFARSRVTVALGGDGGDELLAGYDPFTALRLADLYGRWIPRPVHQGIKMAVACLPVSHRNMSLDFKLKRVLRGLHYPPSQRCPVWMAPLPPEEIAELFGEPADAEDLYSEAIEAWEACACRDPVSRTLQFYTELYLQDDILVKADRASMMHGLEVRSPFLDIEVVDFIRTLPSEFKFRHGTGKWILRQAVRHLVPKEILDRPKKGFGVPVGKWFKDGILHPGDRIAPGLDPAFLARKLAAHRAGHADERAFLWCALALGAW